MLSERAFFGFISSGGLASNSLLFAGLEVIGSFLTDGAGSLGDGGNDLGGEGGVSDPVVDSGGEEVVSDNGTDVSDEVKEGEEEVLPFSERGSGVSSHDEGSKSNPLEGKGSECGHGEGGGESGSGHRGVSSDGNDPGNGERHPGGDEHVNHGRMELVVVVFGVLEDHV